MVVAENPRTRKAKANSQAEYLKKRNQRWLKKEMCAWNRNKVMQVTVVVAEKAKVSLPVA